MKYLSVDRIEGNYVICEDGEKKMFAIELSEVPKGVKEGDVLAISDDGELAIDVEETARRRSKIKKMQNSIWDK